MNTGKNASIKNNFKNNKKVKLFKNFDEQKQILENRNLTFSRSNKDLEILKNNNYYLLTGYKTLLLENNNPEIYKDTATVEELYNLYLFDKNLKLIFLNILLEIEQKIKTMVAYEISKKYGVEEKDYLKASNYDQTNPNIKSTITKIKKQLSSFGKDNKAIKHYKEFYGYVPLWVAVKVLTFGVVHNLYSIMKPSEKNIVAQNVLTIDFEKNRVKYLDSILTMLVDARNMCAHDEIFLNFLHGSVKIPQTKYHEYFDLFKTNNEYVQGRKDLFALIIVIKYFVNRSEYTAFINKINSLINKHMKKVKSYTKEDLLYYMHLPINFVDIKKL